MLKLLKKIQDAIAGYKTYIIAITAIIGAGAAWSEGAISAYELYQAIAAAIAAITIAAKVNRGNPA